MPWVSQAIRGTAVNHVRVAVVFIPYLSCEIALKQPALRSLVFNKFGQGWKLLPNSRASSISKGQRLARGPPRRPERELAGELQAGRGARRGPGSRLRRSDGAAGSHLQRRRLSLLRLGVRLGSRAQLAGLSAVACLCRSAGCRPGWTDS